MGDPILFSIMITSSEH